MDDTTNIISVKIGDRPDGGVRVWSEELPGLHLSGKDRDHVSSMIIPAIDIIRLANTERLKVIAAVKSYAADEKKRLENLDDDRSVDVSESLVTNVWVVMKNDYPDCVFDTEDDAETYCRTKDQDQKDTAGPTSLWAYYRSYELKLNRGSR